MGMLEDHTLLLPPCASYPALEKEIHPPIMFDQDFLFYAFGSSAHFTIEAKVSIDKVSPQVSCLALIDSGATGNFMSFCYFKTLGLEPVPLETQSMFMSLMVVN